MLSAKPIIPKEIKALECIRRINFLLCTSFLILIAGNVFSQDNSPYSRYGLGDLVPGTNIVNRGMGSVTAAFADPLVVNFSNPASYSSFMSFMELRSKKSVSGRVILDIGINFDNRTLREVDPPKKFAVNNILFSYLQVGIPIKHNWGISFGLRPVTRIGYKMIHREKLYDPESGILIDSALTEFSGDGGAFLPSIGTGVAIKNFSIGANVGYLFGRKEYSSKRALINDTVQYNNSNHTTKASFGKIFVNAGIQYKIHINTKSTLTLGIDGNLKQNINASQDIIRETFVRDPVNGDFSLDSVYEQKNIKGQIIYPSSFTAGFVYDRPVTKENSGFLIGADYTKTKWSEYRYFGTTDAVQDNWELHVGGQLRPVSKRNYFSNVDYRAGFYIGQDYIFVGNKLPIFGASFGLGLPIPNTNPLSRGQFTRINVALEYTKRGNNSNVLKENLFRLSVGLNFSDLWFGKRKYE
jgi:hypothetical protein